MVSVPLPDLHIPWHEQPPATVLGVLLWGEARGEPDQGKLAVAEVVRNRVERPGWWGRDWHGVMLKPWQFSCFNENDPSLASLEAMVEAGPEDSARLVWRHCYLTAIWVWQAQPWVPRYGVARGADHYHADGVSPSWAGGRQPLAVVGRHSFYALGLTGS